MGRGIALVAIWRSIFIAKMRVKARTKNVQKENKNVVLIWWGIGSLISLPLSDLCDSKNGGQNASAGTAMAENSPIEWTDATWNPVAGCSIASSGCTNCYAMRMAARLEAMGVAKYEGLTRKSGGRAKWTGAVRCDEAALRVPHRWRAPRKVFVNSMSDLFHADVPIDFIARVWAVMAETPRHDYQLLTKRPDRMREVLTTENFKVLPNVWIGTSVEGPDVVDRIEYLRATPAAIRFISFEPLIGPIRDVNLEGIAWAIIGGESGPAARPMDEQWVWAIESLCRRYDTAFFFKQWGGVNKKATGRLLGGRTYDEMPAYISG